MTRVSQFTASVRAFKVLIDGELVGTIESGDVFEAELVPGRHEIAVQLTTIGTMEGKRSVAVAAGETLHLETSIKIGFLKNELVVNQSA